MKARCAIIPICERPAAALCQIIPVLKTVSLPKSGLSVCPGASPTVHTYYAQDERSPLATSGFRARPAAQPVRPGLDELAEAEPEVLEQSAPRRQARNARTAFARLAGTTLRLANEAGRKDAAASRDAGARRPRPRQLGPSQPTVWHVLICVRGLCSSRGRRRIVVLYCTRADGPICSC
jgi:hypothetical protein